MKGLNRFSAVLAASLFQAGCAMTPVASSPEEIVTQRASAYWAAMMAGEKETAYQYLQPAYRALRDIKFFQASSGGGGAVTWVTAEVAAVECKTPELCRTEIRIGYKTPLGGVGANNVFYTHFDEQWILQDGQWWRYQKP